MKLLAFVLLALLPLLAHSHPAAKKEEKSTPVLALDDVDVDNEPAASGTEESSIQKRSGSFDYVAHLKSGLLSSIGHASASIASGSSGSSSGGGGHSGGGGGGYKSHDSHGHHGNSVVEYDPWSFKKTVLNTIFQAVKAITGGVTALKGQLIKGGGYVLSASGNLVASSGDKVTNLGKNIISSAQINTHQYGHSGGGSSGGSIHPFAKFSSLSGASSGGSSGGGGGGGKHPSTHGHNVIHTETITTYEIPTGGGGHGGPAHISYGPPSKSPTYSSATHQYLPPPSSSGGGGSASYSGGGGAPFSGGHAAFEAPPSNYLPASYDNHYDGYGHQDGHDEFNIYGRHTKLSEAETKKAAAQLQEILGMLPTGKTEFTASKTVTLDSPHSSSGSGSYGPGPISPEHVELQTYGLPNDLGPLESLSHTASITATYAPPHAAPHQNFQKNPSDIYRQMAKKQSPEEVYILNHPEEGYDYPPSKQGPTGTDNYRYNNYHAGNNALKDLTPILAALEVTKRQSGQKSLNGPGAPASSTHYTVEKNVYRQQPPSQSGSSPPSLSHGSQQGAYLPPIVQKTKYTYFDPAQRKEGSSLSPVYVPPPPPPAQSPVYSTTLRQAQPPLPPRPPTQLLQPPSSGAAGQHMDRSAPVFRQHDYEIQESLMFQPLIGDV